MSKSWPTSSRNSGEDAAGCVRFGVEGVAEGTLGGSPERQRPRPCGRRLLRTTGKRVVSTGSLALAVEPGVAVRLFESIGSRVSCARARALRPRKTVRVPDPPETRYARLGEAYIAYQVWGEGPFDLVAARSSASGPVDLLWDEPGVSRTLRRLGGFARNVWFDQRGLGASSRLPPGMGSGPEVWMEDVGAVMASAGSQRAALLGIAEAGTAAMLYAATFPERVSALVLVDTFARFVRGPDYPLGLAAEHVERFAEAMEANWATPAQTGFVAPSMVDDERWSRWWLRSQRLAVTPGVAAASWRTLIETNVHHVLPSIQAPTLVLHRRGDRHARVEHGRYLAEHIPDATYRELDGDDHVFFAGDADALVDEIEEFLTGVRPPAQTDRVLATVLFTDIVDSSERATTLGDERWRKLLDAHDVVVRSQLERFRGREVNTTGDGFVATFDGPARAIRCAVDLVGALRALGIEIRAGLHTREIELRGDDIGGISVHTAQRVQSKARPGEILVSRTVTDLVAGSGITFHDRGEHQLKGIPGSWTLFAIRV
jgi:class 3 adenylate cyclase